MLVEPLLCTRSFRNSLLTAPFEVRMPFWGAFSISQSAILMWLAAPAELELVILTASMGHISRINSETLYDDILLPCTREGQCA